MMPPNRSNADEIRYSRQARLPQIGVEGQRRILAARVAVVGCGALGSHAADALLRAGVRNMRIIDRDLVELSNLPRQVLYCEADALGAIPKAVAAAEALRRIDGSAAIEPIVADFNFGNAESLLTGVDLVVDGCDNYETRYLVNDVAVKRGIPWLYGGCVGTEGRAMAVIPGRSPCLRCLFPEPPPVGSEGTCDTVGILGPAAAVIASLQATEALRLLAHGLDHDSLFVTIDLWRGHFHSKPIAALRDEACACCVERRFEFLSGSHAAGQTSLCGRDAVQVLPSRPASLDLAALKLRLAAFSTPQVTPYFLRATVDALEITIFPDGRAIVRGTVDPVVARSTYSKYVGM